MHNHSLYFLYRQTNKMSIKKYTFFRESIYANMYILKFYIVLNVHIYICIFITALLYDCKIFSRLMISYKKEAHGPHRSPEKQFKSINIKHIG